MKKKDVNGECGKMENSVVTGRLRLFVAIVARATHVVTLRVFASFAMLIVAPAISEAQITFEQFKMLEREFHAEYDVELAQQNAVLFFNKPPTPGADRFWWDIPTVRAGYGSFTDETGKREHYITFMGGFAALKGLTVDAAMMTLCHEIGHGIAGAPHKKRDSRELISIEALADDYAIRVCFPRMTKRIEAMTGHLPLTSSPFVASTPFVEATCAAKFIVPDDKTYCIRAFHALEFERIYYANDKHNPQETSFEAKDPSVVTEINTGDDNYPSAQCRIDTMVAGVLKEARPACWWPSPTQP